MEDVFRGIAKLLLLLVVLAAGGLGLLYVAQMRLVLVGHNAMAPTIVAGDRVLVWKTQTFSLGDIALCRHPAQAGRYVMARVLGKPGHQLTMERGSFRINGEAPERDYRGQLEFEDAVQNRRVRMTWGSESVLSHDYTFFERENRPPRMRSHRVRRGVFLLSDNRSAGGEDSRSFGEVDPQKCIGIVFLRVTVSDWTPAEVEHHSFQFLG